MEEIETKFGTLFCKNGSCESTSLSDPEKLYQLYQCSDEDLDDTIKKGHAGIVNSSGQELLGAIKQLTVIPVPVVVRFP